jgi:hypothetical protein
VYDEDTAAAITRFQIRQGLAISGKLDAATAKALGVTLAHTPVTEPSPSSGSWKRLRGADEQFLKNLNAGVIPPPKTSTDTIPKPSVAAPTVKAKPSRSQPDPHAPPPRLKEDAPAPSRESLPPTSDYLYGPERLRDYVGAFVLAGLDPQVGAELEFFADRVTYFGKPNVPREKIRRDLLHYDERWPERRFWLAGELNVQHEADDIFRVTFPLRYELRSRVDRASGKVIKTLLLRKTGRSDLEIIEVNEKKG